jgi:hypothetical protein
LLCLISANPIIWFSMLVSYRNHKNMIFFNVNMTRIILS